MQFSFAFSGKLHRVSDFIVKFDQGTWNASAFHPPKTSDHCLTEALPEPFKLFTSRWQLIHYIRSSFACQELFSIFFQDFQSVPGVFATFSDRRSSEAAYLVYQTGTRLSRTFFISFFNQTFRPAALADSLIIIRSFPVFCQGLLGKKSDFS